MKLKTVVVVLVASCVFVTAASTFSRRKTKNVVRSMSNDNVMDVEDFSVYYNPETNQTIRDLMPRPWYKPGWLLRLPFTGGRCKCEGLQCTCCTGIRINAFNFDRKTCALLTYEPTESMIDLEVKMNNNSIYRNTFSARNPPPFCVPIPVPYLPPGLVDMCIRLFDVSVVEQKLHVCMDMDTRIDMAPVLILHFDCMDMGFNGVSLSKPGGSGTKPQSETEATTMDPGQQDSDVYDTVSENSVPTTPMFNNSMKYI